MHRLIKHYEMNIATNKILRKEELNNEKPKDNSRFCKNLIF